MNANPSWNDSLFAPISRTQNIAIAIRQDETSLLTELDLTLVLEMSEVIGLDRAIAQLRMEPI